jgi:hypothetical protein
LADDVAAAMRMGMALACMGAACSNPSLSIAFNISGEETQFGE